MSAPRAASRQAAPASTALKPGIEHVRDRVIGYINAQDAAGLYALFDPEMQHALPLEKVKYFVQGVLALHGKLGKATRGAPRGDEREGIYRIEAERGVWQLALHLDARGRIDGLAIDDPEQSHASTAQSEPEPPQAR